MRPAESKEHSKMQPFFSPENIAGELSRQHVSGLKEQSPFLLYLSIANNPALGIDFINDESIKACGIDLSHYKARILSIGEFYIKRKLLSNNWEIQLNQVVYSLLSNFPQK